MPHRTLKRIHRAAVSALFITAIVTTAAGPFGAAVVYAEDPPVETSSDTGGEGAGDTGATSGDAGATSGDGTTSGGDDATTGGSGDANGGSNTGATEADSSGGSGGAGGGTSETTTSGNTESTNESGSGDSPEGGVSSTNSTQSGTPPDGADSSGTPTAATATATTGTPTPSSTATMNGGASVTTGSATAIGNMSTTQIVQMVLAIVNIVMPGVDPASLTAPLVQVTQNADVANIGNATANTGGNSAVVNILTAVASKTGMSTAQLAGMVSGEAQASTGDATAIGNVSWTDIMQFASVIVSVNGDTSLTEQLTSIMQSASVTNGGTSTANTGDNSATVTVKPQEPNGAGGGAANLSGGSAGGDEGIDEETLKEKEVLLWGPATSEQMIVWIYVEGRMCKPAQIVPDPDFAGAFIWETTVAVGECGATRGAEINFFVASPAAQTVVWDNMKRESPEIRLEVATGPVGSALRSSAGAR